MAAPPNYNPTPLTPSAGGTIHAMSGGGGAPAGYNSTPLTPYAEGTIKAYTGGGDKNEITRIAVAAVATKEANGAPVAPKATDPVAPKVTDPVAPNPVVPKAAAPDPATPKVDPAITVAETTAPNVISQKQISLNGRKLTIGPPPFDLTRPNHIEALKWFGVDEVNDKPLQKEVLQALYDGVCDTDKPLIMVLECEPIRRLVQTLAEKLLGNLTRPVVKNTPAVIALKELQSATLMSFNIFKNECKIPPTKEYIESSEADIVCTQQDTNTEISNYTEIKSCGTDENVQRVYLKNGIPSAENIECISENAVFFRYQYVTIVNMDSMDQKIMDEVLKKKPHIILGSFDTASLSAEGYVKAEPDNKDITTTDAIWYKKDQIVFTLKNTKILVPKSDPPVDPSVVPSVVPSACSDHRPITTVIEFNKTAIKLSSISDHAAVVASTEANAAAALRAQAALIETAGRTAIIQAANQSSAIAQPPLGVQLPQGSTLIATPGSSATVLQSTLAQAPSEIGIGTPETATAAVAEARSVNEIEIEMNEEPESNIASTDISDDLAKKIAVAALAVMLPYFNKDRVSTSVSKSSDVLSPTEQMINSLPNNNQQESFNQPQAQSSNQLQASSSNQQQVSSSNQLQASSSNSLEVSSSNQQQASSSNSLEVSSSNQQHVSSSNQQQASSSNQQQASSSNLPQASSSNDMANLLRLQNEALYDYPSITLPKNSTNPAKFNLKAFNKGQPLPTQPLSNPSFFKRKTVAPSIKPNSNVQPIVQPIVPPTSQATSSFFKKKNTVPVYNTTAIKRELDTLDGTISQTIAAATGYTGNSYDLGIDTTLAAKIEILNGYIPQLREYKSRNISFQIGEVRKFISRCQITIDEINEIINARKQNDPFNENEFNGRLGGGRKRRTHKKRKQKKQKKRFVTQKK